MKKITKHTLLVTLALLIVSVFFGGVGSIKELLKNTDPNVLEVPTTDIIYSRAYKTERGGNEILYAFITDKEPEPIPGENIELRTPTSQTKILREFEDTETGKKLNERQTVFTASPQFYKTPDGVWHQIEYATTTQEKFGQSGAIQNIVRREFWEQLLGIKPVFAASSTFYPDPDVETTSVDGQITAIEEGSIPCTATTGNSDDSGTTAVVQMKYLSSRFADTYTIKRVFTLFDTSSLTADATISAATYSVYVTAKTNDDNDGSDTINLITTTPASDTALVNADFDQVGSTLQASAKDITSISTSAYLDFTLNATGEGNISKTGITKFGLREGHDISCTGVNAGTNNITISTAENTGTSQDPKLVVTYTITTSSATPVQDIFWF